MTLESEELTAGSRALCVKALECSVSFIANRRAHALVSSATGLLDLMPKDVRAALGEEIIRLLKEGVPA